MCGYDGAIALYALDEISAIKKNKMQGDDDGQRESKQQQQRKHERTHGGRGIRRRSRATT
jgi:hypothetical protein